MSTVENAIAFLRQLVYQETPHEHLKDTVDNLASCLVLINSSRPSFQAIEKLRSVLREPFQPLYDAYQGPALQLTSAVLSNILDEKLSDAYIHGDPRLYAEWDKTAYVLLSGVLDALEKPPNDHFKVDVGKFLYPTICGFFFRECSQAGPRSSVELCVTAFSILSEAAHGQKSNQIFLRDGAYLGPARLGVMISTSRDYLITESLLTLFARLLSTERAAGGGSMRTQFVQETLGSPELFKCNEELARILHEASTSDWNTIAIQLISAMAKSDITYPQPFSVKEINACGYVFPQPDASDRLILDRQGFLANVILPTGDVCDSLMVPYGHIRMVNIDTPATTLRGVGVTVGLSSAPKVGNTTLKVDSGGFYLAFSLGREDLSRFMETLRRRGIGKLSFINSTQRVVKPKKSISLASEVKFTSDSFLPVPAPDFQEKVKHVKEVYKTSFDDPSSELATVSTTPPDRTRNKPQDGVNSSRCVSTKSFATEDVGELDGFKQHEDDPILKNSFAPHTTSGDQVPQEDSYPTTLKNYRSEGRRSGEQNCKALVSPNRADGATSRTRPLNRERASEDDIAATDMTCGVKKSAPAKSDTNDSGQTRASITQLNGQLPGITAQPGTDVESGVFEADDAISSHSPVIRSRSEDNRQDVGRQAIEASQPEYSEDTKELLTLPKNRASKQSLSNACTAKRVNKRKIQEVTRGSNATHANEFDEEHGSHRKSRKRVGRVPPSNRRTTRPRPIPLDPKNAPNSDAAIVGNVDGFSKTGSATLPPVVFDETSHEIEGEPCGNSADAGLQQGLIPVSTGAPAVAVEKARPKPNLVSSPKRLDSVMREETTGVTTINETPSALAAMSVAVPTTDDSTAVPRARSVSSQLSSSKLIILDGEVSVDIMNSNEAEINGGWKHGRDKLEELRNQESSIPDGPSQVTGGKPNEPIFIPDLTPRLSDPEFSNAGGVTPEIVLVREAGPSLDSSVVEPGDDVVGPGLTTGCLTQVISDEDIDKSKNLDSLESKGRELVQNFATEAVGLPTFLSPPPQKHRSQTALSPPPRKRHSVTFASPIETLMHPNAHAGVTPNSDRGLQMPVEPFRQRTWRQEGRQRKDDRIVGGERFKNSYTSKDDALLPMLVPKTTVSSTGSICISDMFTANETMTDGVDIKDIVEVLDDIHAVITRSITKRFENMRKDVRGCREELLQEVLQDLEITAATNAKQFNDLVQLEEEYYEYHSSMTYRWQELIQCNENLLSHLKNVVRDHDRSISAKTCPASILPREPLFSGFKDRLMS